MFEPKVTLKRFIELQLDLSNQERLSRVMRAELDALKLSVQTLQEYPGHPILGVGAENAAVSLTDYLNALVAKLGLEESWRAAQPASLTFKNIKR